MNPLLNPKKPIANLLRIIEICHRGDESDHPFFRSRIIAQKICSQKLWSYEKRTRFVRFQKVLIKIDEMADVFLNSTNFAQHAFFTLTPPSSNTWNLKTLTKVLKVSWSSQLSYKILWSPFERKFRKDKLYFSEKIPPKSPGSLGLTKKITYRQIESIFSVHVQDAVVSWVVWMAPAIEP